MYYMNFIEKIIDKITNKVKRREWLELLYYIFLFYDLDENNDTIMYNDISSRNKKISRRIVFEK